jgi:membrane protease YdiL (CAAX protease family)
MEKIKKTLKSFFLIYSPVTRERGDDTGVLLYGAFWVYIQSTLLFTNDASLRDQMFFYLYFDLMCVIFMVMHLWRSSNKHIDIVRPSNIVDLVPWVIAGMLGLIILGYVLDLTIGNVIGAALQENMLFHFLRLIETEELVYRGLAIEVFLLLDRTRPLEQSEDMSAWHLFGKHKFFFAGSIASSIFFGAAHYDAYAGAIAPLLYLTIMGFVAAFLRFKFGLIAPILLHVLNNYIAMSDRGSAWILLVVVEIIVAFLDVMLKYLQSKGKGERW